MLLNNKHYYNLPPQERKNLWKHYKKVYPNMGYTDMVKHFNGEVENYQMGGETTSSPDVTEAKDYMKDWYNSPMYKNIYQSQLKDLGMSNPKRIERVTNRAVNLANQSNFDVNPTVVKDLGKYGEGSYDNKGARIIKLDKNFVENNPKLVNSLYTHELAHDNLMTAKDEEYISKNTPKFNSNLYNEQQYSALTNPEEVRSQIHSIRQLGKKNKIYDPLTQPFKKEYLDKINESYKQGTKESEDYNQVQRLRKFYSDDQITDMLNKVTKTKSTDQSVYAKHGGIIKTHQFGGETKNSFDKKNEDYVYNQWRKSLPKNLRNESKDYNLRGAWEAGLQPEYVVEDMSFHLKSRNPNTGEILKSPGHSTYNMAIEGDIKAGYAPRIDVKTGKVYTINPNDPATAGPFKNYQFGGRTDYFNSDVKKFVDGGKTDKYVAERDATSTVKTPTIATNPNAFKEKPYINDDFNKYVIDAAGTIFYPASLVGSAIDFYQGDNVGGVAGLIPFGKGYKFLKNAKTIAAGAGASKSAKKFTSGVNKLMGAHVGTQVYDAKSDLIDPLIKDKKAKQ